MAVAAEVYNQFARLAALGALAGPLKLALVDSVYVFDAAHTAWADASANEIAGTGYTAGGAALSGLASTTETTNDAKTDATDTTWTNATVTFRRAILYYDGTLDGIVNPVLISYLADDTPADTTITNTDLLAQWAAAGIVTYTVA